MTSDLDTALRVLAAGDRRAPVLLVGPSLGTSVAELWQPVVERLQDRFTVVGWDLPGHGAAPPPKGDYSVAELAGSIAVDLAEAIGATPVHVAGDSIGGAVAMQLALDHPQLVATVTACCTGARIGDHRMWSERIETVTAGGTAAVVDGSAQRWFGPGFVDREPATAQALLDTLRAVDDTGYLAACGALAEFDVRPLLAQIDAPVLAVAGADDRVAPPDGLRQIADTVRDGHLVILDGVAHLAPVEAPTRVAALIAQHANRLATVDDVERAGLRERRVVLGEAHVDRAAAATTDFTKDFQQFITQYAWGSVWTRPGLARRERSLITLTALVALGHHDELALHVRGALRNGLTPDEIGEALLHAAVYVGVPAANTAFRIAQDVIVEEKGAGRDRRG